MTTEIITEANKYFAIAVLAMPGIVMITLRRWITPINNKFFSQDLIRFISYGFFNFIVFLFITKLPFVDWDITNIFKWNVMNNHPTGVITFTFILPVILGGILCICDKTQILQIIFGVFGLNIETNIATAWEETFDKHPGMHVDITLKNQQVIHGYFGKKSSASTYLEKKDIYLERVDAINDMDVKNPTSMWIDGNEISHIAFVTKEKSHKCNCSYILLKIYELLAKMYRKMMKG